jgi:hypothetical protein
MTTLPEFHTLVNPTRGLKYTFAVNHALGKVQVLRTWIYDGETEDMGMYPIVDARNLWNNLANDDEFVGGMTSHA